MDILALRFAPVAAIGMIASACQILPAQGPQGAAIAEGAAVATEAPTAENGNALPYVLINVDERILNMTKSGTSARFAGTLTDRRSPAPLVLGAGDVLSISIFESAPGGLFTPPTSAGAKPGNFVELPPQTVGRDGLINVPYAGTINVTGRTANEVERLIESRLRSRAIEPQVVLTLREQRNSQVAVLGEVNAAAKINLNPKGERVLDVIARAGGTRFPAYESVVSLQRGGRKAQVSLDTLVKNPENNIFVMAGDTIYVSREQRYFVALGASGQNGVYSFDTDQVTLAYAMGKAGGLLDERADPNSVFVYRLVPRRQVESYGVDLTGFRGQVIPVVYAVHLRQPSSIFLTQAWGMQDRDVIFVGNAASVEISKALQFLRIGINTVREGAALREPYVR